ncbi:type II toxin-antitoxin system VapC family toxin [Gordonia sp. (in: high G+C Gram-positive bacteria)]|jgi:predicted nucleic acid-binding protein|uniref:type II toxin-antitoxin system VapC family toxin n=1 Tax=Gordonia sp. (in: high G+C Gram-positive bacteria) TaxID=84139 RepID=UPI001DDDA739|nr:type II toxin-antitoxin system VapC family toxin [Gordonia sp. (in: high G+C Gram-positive bacteria)]MCB1294050.1 type II toxin-antitoxin system VapC family toxin [Gordonia sp. (in: high G+C Gram-positive bacteria)]HMS76064.1 type II toxin-antitoxin system VapC family toxin [Gordonia sp. (in: high G+C Gram-positive bacteria)]HQV16823.1 type II toxin-antitoxin system VapC family toxin [Gordonia sp. (in: high G+C Gram-positive bacteria)]
MSESTLVDSNVLLDVFTDDPVWSGWSGQALAEAMDRGTVIINPIVYAEVSVGFDRIEDLDALLPTDYFIREALPWSAGFLAGKAFLAYRRRGGTRPTPLPDFYIGAHAGVSGHRLLTRDLGRYATSFPQVVLVTPDT